jgi:O-antigen/teichoic acid export membrane protein
MRKPDSLARNSVYLMATTAVNSALGYVYWIAAARAFSPHDVGLANALIAAMMLASVVSNLGVPIALVEILPRHRDDRAWSQTLLAALAVALAGGVVAGLLVAIGLPAASSRFSVLSNPLYGAAFVVGVPAWTAVTILDYTFVAERRAGRMLTRNAAFGAMKLVVLAVPVVLVHGSALWILLSWIIAAVVSLLAGVWLLHSLGRRVRLAAAADLVTELRAIWARLAGHHLTTLGGVLPMSLLPLLVTVRLSALDNAYFALTWMVGNIFMVVSPAVASSLLAEGAHAPAQARQQAVRALGIVGALLIVPMAICLFGADEILALFGHGYPEHGAMLLRVLVLSAIPDAVTNIWVSYERAMGRLRRTALLNGGMAAATLILAWVLLPGYGIAGVGLAWLAAQIMGTVAAGCLVVRDRRLRADSAPISDARAALFCGRPDPPGLGAESRRVSIDATSRSRELVAGR